MEYKFKGVITSIKNYEIPFQVIDGVVKFSLQSKSILPIKNQSVILSGVADNKCAIYLLINRFYELGFTDYEDDGNETISYPHLEGIIEVCVVLDSGTIDDVNSLGFYSPVIPKITGQTISGALNDANSSWTGIKNTLGKFILDNRKYRLSIGFVENEPYYTGQLLELKTENKLNINSMKESYWLIKRFLTFLFQKTNVPIDEIYLRNNEKNIGYLFVERLEKSKLSFFGIKCIQINILEDKIDRLLQLLAEKKLYLRHVPMFKDEERVYTPGRFLMALVGLENTLDYMDIHVKHSEKHLCVINRITNKLEKLVEESTSDEKRIYNRFLKQLDIDENLEARIRISLEDDKEYINNFFPLDILGGIKNIAKDLSDVRNDLAHGDLNADLGIKADYQMHFSMLYILYLQLKMIGFDKKSASKIVPQILFRH